MIRTTSIVIAGAVGVSLLAAAAMQTERHQQDRAEIEAMEGIIVDLHHYMTMEETPDLGDPGIAGENFGGPVGLLVEQERAILPKRTVLYVVLAEPENAVPRESDMRNVGGPRGEHDHTDRDKADKAGKAMINKAQKMTGERVRITGKELERDNVKAIVIRTIDEVAALPPDRD